MKTSTDIDILNNRLRDHFGLFENGQPNFRIVWSEDQFEYRFGTYEKRSASGLYLGEETVTKYVPKYSQWMPNQWVLERLTGIGGKVTAKELTTKTSWEPLFGFGIGRNNIQWDSVKVLIEDLLEKAHAHFYGPKYKEGLDTLPTKEGIEYRVNAYKKLLAENDSPMADALYHGEGVAIPNKQFEELDVTKVKVN